MSSPPKAARGWHYVLDGKHWNPDIPTASYVSDEPLPEDTLCRYCQCQWEQHDHMTGECLNPLTSVPAPVEEIDHPAHYGGEDDPYEAIKVIEAWELGFNLGNAVKYIARAGRKPGVDRATDLKKALWYLEREVTNDGSRSEGD